LQITVNAAMHTMMRRPIRFTPLLASIEAADPKTGFALGVWFIFEDGPTIAIPVLAADFIAKASLFGFFAWTHRNSGAAPTR
jgi:hypothetical protein